MKKYLVIVAMAFVLALTACGGDNSQGPSQSVESSAVENSEAEKQPVAVDASAENFSEKETAEESKETVSTEGEGEMESGLLTEDEKSEEEKPEEEKTEEGTDADAQAGEGLWVDNLYAALMAGNWDEVISLAGNRENVFAKAGEFEKKDWPAWGYENAFPMTTSDGKHLTIVVQTMEGENIYVIACEHSFDEYGLEGYGYDDTVISYFVLEDGSTQYESSIYENKFKVYKDGKLDWEDPVSNGTTLMIWHT